MLEALAWPPEVERAFLRARGQRLPRPTYAVDRDRCAARTASLQSLSRKLPNDADDPVVRWLADLVASLIEGNQLLLAAGTPAFSARSRALYGSARSRFPGDAATNLDLARHVLARFEPIGDERVVTKGLALLDAAALEARFRGKLERSRAAPEVAFVREEGLSAKVVAGSQTVRLRADVQVTRREADGLYHHEIETHVFTARNGAAQTHAPFLRTGGPRATHTQEGLAVFAELRSGGLTTARLRRLAQRVLSVDAAEQGASFVDVWRMYRAWGSTPRDAYLDAQRVFRGGRLEGGGPFTKDVVYLSGLLHVYTLLSCIAYAGLHDEAELLVCGRIAVEDLPALVQLRNEGLLTRPLLRPSWLERWDELLPYFAFTSFERTLDLSRIRRRARQVLARARA